MAGASLHGPRGTRDRFPEDLVLARHLERVARRVAEAAGYGEVRPPLFEETRLFQRSLGETSDVVEKEMFTVVRRAEPYLRQDDPVEKDLSELASPSYTFRPEGTAGIARAYAQGGFAMNAPFQKWYYLGPMFRYERPQRGRERQFDQFGIEAFGSASPLLDAEVVDVAACFFEALGLGGALEVRINTMGDPRDRAAWGEALRAHFAGRLGRRCDDCRERHARNVFRLLDCKQPACIEDNAAAPPLAAVLSEEARAHHEAFGAALRTLGRAPREDPGIVRGLDYYTRSVFEVHYPPLGARSALCGGGRYDGLVEQVGGRPTPAVGFSVGLTPTELALAELDLPPAEDVADLRAAARPQAYVVAITAEERVPALALAHALRSAGVRAVLDHRGRSARAQFKEADRCGARFALVLGPEERTAGRVVVRDLAAGEERAAEQPAVPGELARALA